MAIANKVFVCSVCESDPRAGFTKLRSGVRLADLILENPVLMNMFGFRRSLAPLLFPGKAGHISLHKLVTIHRDKILTSPKCGKWEMVETLMYKGEKIRDVRELQERLSNILCGKTTGTCSLCFDDQIPIASLRDACGHCSHRCCEECLKSWYIQNKPGELFLEARARCPFCRSFPIYKVMRYMNQEIYAIRERHASLSNGLRSDMYYAWCTDCYRIRESMTRTCAMGSVPKIKNFVCESCIENKVKKTLLNTSKDAMKLLPNTGTCPVCKNLVLKTSGCDHITCRCGAHWCFRCEKKFSNAHDCYKHLSSCDPSDHNKKNFHNVAVFLSKPDGSESDDNDVTKNRTT